MQRAACLSVGLRRFHGGGSRCRRRMRRRRRNVQRRLRAEREGYPMVESTGHASDVKAVLNYLRDEGF